LPNCQPRLPVTRGSLPNCQPRLPVTRGSLPNCQPRLPIGRPVVARCTHCTYPPLHCIARRCTALHATRCNDATTGGFRQEGALCQIARLAIRLAKYSLSSRPYATRFCDWPPSTLPRAPSLGNERANVNPARQSPGQFAKLPTPPASH
jgi:hypothetical protein